MAYRYVVEAYRKIDGSHFATYLIQGVTLSQLQALFGVPKKNPMFDAFPVNAGQGVELADAVEVRFDFDVFNYYVTCDEE